MKYLIFLVFCGSLALEANGVRVRMFLQDSEKEDFREVADTARRAIKVKKRFEKRNPKDEPEARYDEAPKKENYDYERSVVKILKAVKKIMTKGEPLLYPKEVGCGKGVKLKCQFTTNATEDEYFFGYQDKPRKTMMRVMDSIDRLVSHPILRTYVEIMDYSGQDSAEAGENEEIFRAQDSEFDIKKMKLGKILKIVNRVVHRDPEEASEKFVCGIQMDKEKSSCKYYEEGTPAKSILGFRFDAVGVNDAVKRVFASREVMKGFIKIANDVAGIFPSLRPGAGNARFKKNDVLSTQQKSV